MTTYIRTPDAPAPIGPYNQASFVNGFLFVSGQICINPQTGLLENETMTTEAHRALKNAEAILKASKMDFSNVLKCSIFITNMAYFEEINKVYEQYFTSNFPAREVVEVAGLPKNVNFEISLIAFKQQNN